MSLNTSVITKDYTDIWMGVKGIYGNMPAHTLFVCDRIDWTHEGAIIEPWSMREY